MNKKNWIIGIAFLILFIIVFLIPDNMILCVDGVCESHNVWIWSKIPLPIADAGNFTATVYPNGTIDINGTGDWKNYTYACENQSEDNITHCTITVVAEGHTILIGGQNE